MEKSVLLEIEDGTALITLNRPDRRNAINQDLLVHLYNSIEEVHSNDSIKVGIITGSGNSFCSGIDLEVIAKDNLIDPRGDGKDLPDVFSECKTPIIGAVNGHAITGGLEIALNCDFLIASENASFKDTHARIGIPPGWGMTQLLQQAVGQRMAKQMSFSCQSISANKALQCGLVNEVVPHDVLLQRAKQIASDICVASPDMVAVLKDLIKFKNSATLNEAFANERKGCKDFMYKIKGS
ncbi:MAG: enoyl-CoA hydratase [Thermodesulfobacteriota bacterium]|nr:enoyl-CoA hydratase [Thermodesulfobacteriota bacterium]